MTTVAVFSQKSNDTALLLAGSLSRFGGVCASIPPRVIARGQSSPDFFVAAVDRLESIEAGFGILAAADSAAPRRAELADDVKIVAHSDNRRVRKAFVGRNNQAIICGTGALDTLTLSSSGQSRLLLCLQRSIETCRGAVEPCEFEVKYEGADIRTAILVAGIMLVCGCDASGGFELFSI